MRAWLFGDGMIDKGKLKYRSFARQSVLSAMATSQTPMLMRVELSEDGSCEVLKAMDVSEEVKEWSRWCALRVLNSQCRNYWNSELKAFLGCFISERRDLWPVYVASISRLPQSTALLEAGVFLDNEAAIIADLDRRMERLFEEVL